MIQAVRVDGHFGEYLQGRLGPDGPVVLVTLPCPLTGVIGTHHPARHGLKLAGAGLSVPQVQRFIASLRGRLTGHVRLRARMAAGLGTGVSTARLVALARLSGWDGPPEVLARACIAVEGASDPLMFAAPERLLWASRQGRALRTMPALPRHEVIGGHWGAPQRTDARDDAFPDISDLVADWAQADSLASFAALGRESARRCIRLRGPSGDPTEALAQDMGALGWVMAHTGAMRGLIFAPGQVPAQARATLRAAGLRGIVQFKGGTE
ncbi:uncharacterized protein involved in propanediol utilization [Roseinatronobacter thiooxidans]|uniref:Uncharacterized protein involved in propanediol utilization n=1 Tax=Roseinatronobacter thiooxidans TaxID=121821 RepID=A0A2W7QLM8_9RHOB|nr:hypothetical protein [Roseinatronobacter thiooxidans]PZX42179.1 uncharacterized protein involved in propanediol utilization [Roseinatronobacter thiooxidans]